MRKLSDIIHGLPFGDFKISGDFDRDVENYIKLKNVPIKNQNLDNNFYAMLLLRLKYGKNIIAHTLTDGVIEKIKHTRIENIPNEIPRFMKYPFIIEARHDKFLFDNIFSIGGFIIDNEICLVIGGKVGNEDGIYCQHEKASFDGRNIEDINLVYSSELNNMEQAIQIKTRKDTFAFATILSLMLEAEKTPLLIENIKQRTNNNKIPQKNNTETEWTIKRIYIDRNIKYKNKSNEHNVLDKNGKQLKNVIITGFLRTQHYGPELSQTKTIYVESFDSTRWTYNKDKKIIVDIYGEKNI